MASWPWKFGRGNRRQMKSSAKALKEKRAMAEGLKADLGKERKTLRIFGEILKERHELLEHNEKKVIQLKREYEDRLKGFRQREKELSERAKAMKGIERSNMGLLKAKSRLEAHIKKLLAEEPMLKSVISRKSEEAKRLSNEEARKRAEVAVFERKLAGMKSEFNRLSEALAKAGQSSIAKEAELKRIATALKEAESAYSRIMPKLHREGAGQMAKRIRQAQGYVSKGLLSEAKSEYDKIRELYSYLSKEDKKKVYAAIAALRDALLKTA